jgi:hypothetical protein
MVLNFRSQFHFILWQNVVDICSFDVVVVISKSIILQLWTVILNHAQNYAVSVHGSVYSAINQVAITAVTIASCACLSTKV